MNDLIRLFYIRDQKEFRLAIHQSVLASFPNIEDSNGDSAFWVSICNDYISPMWGYDNKYIPDGYKSKKVFCDLAESKTLLRLSRKLLGSVILLSPSDASTSDDECTEIFI